MAKSHALFFILLLTWHFAQAQSPQVCSKHLKIQESTQQHWNPGILKDNSEQAGGEIYEVKIKVRKGGYVRFENLIIDNQMLPVEVKQNGNRNVAGPFKKGDEVSLIARTNKQKQITAAEDAVLAKMKDKGASAAVIYSNMDKKYIHTITNFTVTQSGKPIQ